MDFDINIIHKDKDIIIISSEDALRDVEPFIEVDDDNQQVQSDQN